ncbi:MAG: hypothetical protein AAF960_01245 [Bacteroidota bacterium]
MFQQCHYDAFSGISFAKKNALVNFLIDHLDATSVNSDAILTAVEYAAKEIPSFGGFILTAEENQEIVAALVVNKTGLSGLMPDYLAVLQAVKPLAKSKLITRKLEEKAIALTKGNIANLIHDFGPEEFLLEKMQPQATFRPIHQVKDNAMKATA